MGKLAKAVIAGSAVGLSVVIVRGIRNASAAQSDVDGPTDANATSTATPNGTYDSAGQTIVEPTTLDPMTVEPVIGSQNASSPVVDVATGPATPLPEPHHPRPYQRINWSHYDKKTGTVRESPAALLVQALRFDPDVTLDELTAARLAKSEHGSGSFTELACIIDAELNRSHRRGQSLYQSLTYIHTYGKQGRRRKASTRQDPQIRHLLAARAVLSGEARGISRGAVRFFDPESMEHGHRKWKAWLARGKTGDKPSAITCDALGLLEAWSFDYGYHSKYRRCPPNRGKLGRNPQAWVGPIAGVDAWRLMLMKPMTRGTEHTRRYEAARALIESRLVKRTRR